MLNSTLFSIIYGLVVTEWVLILLIVLGVLLFVAIILVIALAVYAKKSQGRKTKADKVKVIKGVRYSVDDNIIAGGVNVTHNKGDLILEKGKTYKAEKKGVLMPGHYTVLSSSESVDKYNIRHGGFVREYKHGDAIVIGENDVITAVSHSVVLR